MIKEKELREMRPQVRYRNGKDITLEVIKEALKNAADDAGVPVGFREDVVLTGGLLSGTGENCLVLFHPEHPKDYFNICVRVKYQGNYAFVTVNDFGVSRLLGNKGSHDYLMETLKHGKNSERVGALIGSGMRRLVRGAHNNQKLEEEQMWYTIISDIFDDIVS